MKRSDFTVGSMWQRKRNADPLLPPFYLIVVKVRELDVHFAGFNFTNDRIGNYFYNWSEIEQTGESEWDYFVWEKLSE